MPVLRAKNENQFQHILQNNENVLVGFYVGTASCMENIYLLNHLYNDVINFPMRKLALLDIDSNELKVIAEDLNIRDFPTYTLFKMGQEVKFPDGVGRVLGTLYSKDDLKIKIKTLIEANFPVV